MRKKKPRFKHIRYWYGCGYDSQGNRLDQPVYRKIGCNIPKNVKRFDEICLYDLETGDYVWTTYNSFLFEKPEDISDREVIYMKRRIEELERELDIVRNNLKLARPNETLGEK